MLNSSCKLMMLNFPDVNREEGWTGVFVQPSSFYLKLLRNQWSKCWPFSSYNFKENGTQSATKIGVILKLNLELEPNKCFVQHLRVERQFLHWFFRITLALSGPHNNGCGPCEWCHTYTRTHTNTHTQDKLQKVIWLNYPIKVKHQFLRWFSNGH